MLFDERGVLLNNIAWLLRRLPVFAIGGDGDYRVRPIHVDDLAALALEASRWPDDRIVDAVGPERPTFLRTGAADPRRRGQPGANRPCAGPGAARHVEGARGRPARRAADRRTNIARWPKVSPIQTRRPPAR